MGNKTQGHNEEFDNRVYKIIKVMIGISGLISIILALMLLAAGGIGLFALIKFVLA